MIRPNSHQRSFFRQKQLIPLRLLLNLNLCEFEKIRVRSLSEIRTLAFGSSLYKHKIDPRRIAKNRITIASLLCIRIKFMILVFHVPENDSWYNFILS